MALVKAVGYYLARFNLDLSSNGYVQGAGYTDVHARLPALELLILVSLAAAVLLIYNIRRQGWALPILGVGLWFLVALTAGTIYPAAVQALKVNPAQNTLERPYIQRNIDATRAAMGINKVASAPYPASLDADGGPADRQQRHPGQHPAVGPAQTAAHLRQAPGHPFLLPVQQRCRSTGTRWTASRRRSWWAYGRSTPADLPSTSWVNTTLQYTHGYGMIVSPTNTATTNGTTGGTTRSSPWATSRRCRAADYRPSPSRRSTSGSTTAGYVVANTKQPEIDYQLTSGTNVETHYKGDGGVQLSNFFKQVMFAVRFNDLNLLISNQITNHSRSCSTAVCRPGWPRPRRS